MTNTKYGLMKAEERTKLPDVNLLCVPHGSERLIVARFGPNTYVANRSEMAQHYWNSSQRPDVSFRHGTTSESISASAYNFRNIAKPEILDPNWLQSGYIVRTSEGVFANPPLDGQGKPIVDEQELKKLLNGVKPTKLKGHSLYIVDNSADLRDFGFAENDTFTRGIQSGTTFAQGGLARVLEHTKKPAKVLKGISSKRNYLDGVNVYGFDAVRDPVLRVADLYSNRGDGRLRVVGGWNGNGGGYAFGVLDKSPKATQ